MFKNFDINFVDKDDKPLPIIVLAGVNGSGKTTLLEYVYDYMKYLETRRAFLGSNFIEIVARIKKPNTHKGLVPTYETPLTIHTIQRDNFTEYIDIYKQNIIYIPANQGLEDIKEFLPKYLFKKIFDEKADVEQTYKDVRDYINKIFKDLDIKIDFDSRDAEGNLYFRNKNSVKISIDDISTGEKTLLSKVLYLYIKEIKDSVILIDEPELSLHPRWQSQVLKLYENFAKENNCQIIIATHSPHIIGSAKNEYIRILRMNKNDEVEVINDVMAYGRDINWVLREMGLENTRPSQILQKIKDCKALLEDDKYDEAEKCIDSIESIIGSDDREILALRNSLEFWRE